MIRLPTLEETNKIYQDTKDFYQFEDEQLIPIFEFVYMEMVNSCFVHSLINEEAAQKWIRKNGCSRVFVHRHTLIEKLEDIKSYGIVGSCPAYAHAGFDSNGGILDVDILDDLNYGIRDSYGSILIKENEFTYRHIQCFIHYTCPYGFRRRLEDEISGVPKPLLIRIVQYLTNAFTNLRKRLMFER